MLFYLYIVRNLSKYVGLKRLKMIDDEVDIAFSRFFFFFKLPSPGPGQTFPSTRILTWMNTRKKAAKTLRLHVIITPEGPFAKRLLTSKTSTTFKSGPARGDGVVSFTFLAVVFCEFSLCLCGFSPCSDFPWLPKTCTTYQRPNDVCVCEWVDQRKCDVPLSTTVYGVNAQWVAFTCEIVKIVSDWRGGQVPHVEKPWQLSKCRLH